jgi:hypothetical protein
MIEQGDGTMSEICCPSLGRLATKCAFHRL